MSSSVATNPGPDALRSRAGLRRWVVDRNPFYLLSGLCMLFGCFAISIAIHQEPERVRPLLALIGILNVYELLILGLGLYLACRRGLARDAGVLLVLAVVLMFDVPFLYNELLTESVVAGVPVSAGAFVLAPLKIALLVWLLPLSLSGRAWLLIVLNLLIVLALPGVLRTLFLAEQLHAPSLYAIWWGVGALIALHAIEPMHRPQASGGSDALRMLGQVLRHALLSVPLIAVIAHVAAGHFIYERALTAPMLAPPLLGLGVYVIHQLPAGASRRGRRQMVTLLGIAAVYMSTFNAPALMHEFTWPMTWTGSPMRLTLLAAALVWLHVGWSMRDWWVGMLAGVAPLIALLGHTPRAVMDRIDSMAQAMREWAPNSLMDWGIVGVIAAFVLLCIGAAVSLRRKPADERGPDRPEV